MKKTIYSREGEILRELLRRTRIERGLTQTTLAAKLHKPQSFVAKIENGERRLDIIEFLEYASATGTAPRLLLAKLEAALNRGTGAGVCM